MRSLGRRLLNLYLPALLVLIIASLIPTHDPAAAHVTTKAKSRETQEHLTARLVNGMTLRTTRPQDMPKPPAPLRRGDSILQAKDVTPSLIVPPSVQQQSPRAPLPQFHKQPRLHADAFVTGDDLGGSERLALLWNGGFYGAFAEQTAYTNFLFPPGKFRGSNGKIYDTALYAPTFHAEGTCIEVSTQYKFNKAFLDLYDTCNNVDFITYTINTAFSNEYMTKGALDPGLQQLPLYVVSISRDINHALCSPNTCDYAQLYDFVRRKYIVFGVRNETFSNQDGWDMFETHYAGDLSCVNHPFMESGVIRAGGYAPTPANDPVELSPDHDCWDRSQNDPPYENFGMTYNVAAPYYGFWRDYYK